ncbi:MAG: HAD family hydrolase [Spirochaetales bacterium]|nr:HAD family hydrolase [Spirochaetales bacterium]
MKVFFLPKHPRALLFDIDGTLYDNDRYARFQVEVLVEELARVRGRPLDEVRAEVERARRELGAREGRETTSLGNAMAALGVDLATSVAWRERLIEPSAWLARDLKLDEALALLARRFKLAAVTNNPRLVALKGLAALGVEARFEAVVGLDDTMRSKPAREPFELAARLLGVALTDCVSIGDRHDVDLAVPLELGAGGILVDGASDVLLLPGLLIG